MSKTNKEQLAIASKYLGKGGATFRKYCGLPSGAAWCDAFVTYIFNEAGNSALFCDGKKQTYCPNTIKILQREMAQIPLYLAMPSDVIFFDWDKNGTPNHIGFVRARNTTDSIYTIEGNTDGGKVANKTRNGKYVQAVFRPHFKATYKLGTIAVDGDFGYNSIANLQKALGCSVDGILGLQTVKALQKRAGVSADGQWGKATSKAVQKMVGTTADGAFGKNSVKALQNWINKQNGAVKKKTNADKLVDQMKALAWSYGTARKTYDYKTGAPKTACKTAMMKYGYKKRAQWSDCGDFVNTVVRESGIDKDFTVQKSVKAAFPSPGEHFTVVFKGKKIPDGTLKPGDIIRYKKKSGQHAMFYFGDGKICDAGHYDRFGNIRKNDHRYNGSNVKHNTIQVLRAK